MAAPVLSAHERVIAAVGIAGPTLRFRGKELAQKVALVTEIGARLAMSLGRLEMNHKNPVALGETTMGEVRHSAAEE